MSNSGDCPSGTGALVNQAPVGLGPEGLRSPVEDLVRRLFSAVEGCRLIGPESQQIAFQQAVREWHALRQSEQSK